MPDLARLGARMYHYSSRPGIRVTEPQKRLGELSVTDGVFIPREAPEPTDGIG